MIIIPLFITAIEDPHDRELLTEYYTQHRYTLMYVAQSILHDPGLAEDAMQEAFYRLAKNIKRIRPVPKQVRSFLVTIVKNVSIDILHRQKNASTISLDTLVYDPVDPVNTEDIAIQHTEAEAVEELVMTLPVIYSTVFLLRYKHDLSNNDIAKLLEISEAAVSKRISRAKEKITEKVTKWRLGEDA